MNRRATLGCALFLLLVVAIRFAEPVLDGDLFFHLAYGRQMLERHTLIPDHTLYSWTPASTRTIYCVWLSELLLLGLWNAAGLAGIFALRYGVVLAVAALLWGYARRTGWHSSSATWLIALGPRSRRAGARDTWHSSSAAWLVALVTLLASVAGTIVKPELLSLLLFHILVFLYFEFKARAREGRPEIKWLYGVPVLVAVWANVHGAFVMAAPFLLATAAGEALNRRFSAELALPRRVFGHLLTAWALTGVAVLLTPYGWRYPWQLFEDYVLRRTPRPDEIWNAAHQWLFSASGREMHLPEYLAIMALAIGATVWLSRRRLDFTVVLANLVFVPLFLVYLRTTYFWPAVFAYSFLYAGVECRKWLERRVAVAACVALLALFGGRAIYESWRGAGPARWLGFGIGYQNPVMEAEYLAAHPLGPRVYNTFDSGPYLLWRLYPGYRVMTDARSFPYLDWFDDQYRFTLGQTFEDFLKKYPADTAVIDLEKTAHWRRFLTAPNWRPVFYGPTSAIFVRRECCRELQLRDADSGRFSTVRNAHAALRAFSFAGAAGDRRTAWAILDAVERRLKWQADADSLAAARDYRTAHRYVRERRYEDAIPLFDRALKGKQAGPGDFEIVARLVAIRKLREAGQGNRIGPFAAELDGMEREED